MFEAIMLWDKVLNYEERSELVKNNWSIKEQSRKDGELIDEVCEMTAEHMSEIDLEKLHQAMILSPRTMFHKKKLDKIEKLIKSQWNKLRLMHPKHIVHPTGSPPREGDYLMQLGILPQGWCHKNAPIEWDNLSYTVKHLLRASYNPSTNRFEQLERFGRYAKGVIN